METAEKLYREEFARHIAAGDDDMNAQLRIIEQGCPVPLAERIAIEEGEDDTD